MPNRITDSRRRPRRLRAARSSRRAPLPAAALARRLSDSDGARAGRGVRAECVHPHRRAGRHDADHAAGRDGAGHLHVHRDDSRRGARRELAASEARACAAERCALRQPVTSVCKSPATRTPMRAFWTPLRKAGATARAMLIEAAARRWNVSAERLPHARAAPSFTPRPAASSATASSSADASRVAAAGRCAAEVARGLSVDRQAAEAPRHGRQGQRQGASTDRRAAARREVRDGRGVPRARRQGAAPSTTVARSRSRAFGRSWCSTISSRSSATTMWAAKQGPRRARDRLGRRARMPRSTRTLVCQQHAGREREDGRRREERRRRARRVSRAASASTRPTSCRCSRTRSSSR